MNAVSRVWRTWCDTFVPSALRDDVDAHRRARFIVAVSTLLVPLAILREASVIAAGMRVQGVAVAGMIVACTAAPLALRRTGSLVLSGNLIVAAAFLAGVAMSVQRGGIGAPILIGIGALPLIAIFVAGTRSGITWTALVVLLIAALGVYEYAFGGSLPDRLPAAARLRMELAGALLFPIAILGIGLAYEWAKNAALEARARAERERLRAEEAARMLRADRMASVGQIAAGVAHEINNPLAYIAGNLDFIARELRVLRAADLETERPELVSAVSEARQGIDRVASIVRDLKTFVRDDEQQTGLVDVRTALDAAIRIAENEIRHRARLVRHYENQPAFVRVNETRLVQVFLNLLVNAAHAIQPGATENNSIHVRLTTRDGRAEITIVDTGSGMSSEVLARALDPFFTTKPIGIGTGLGLSVCSNVIRTSGGELLLESEPSKGTTVTIRLPHEEPSPEARRAPLQAASTAAQAALRVLVIDDDPLVVRSLRRLLKPHDVTSVEHAPQALRLLDGDSGFDLILCDLMMPELTGAELYQRVAAWGRGTEQQIVFITGGVFTEQMQRFLETVPNRRLEKPIRADELDALIAHARR